MIAKNQNLLSIACISSVVTLALCFFVFSTPVKYAVNVHSPYTISSVDDGIQDDAALFFESAEDPLTETLRAVKSGIADVTLPSAPLIFLAELFGLLLVLSYPSLASRVSQHSLWQKTTTSL